MQMKDGIHCFAGCFSVNCDPTASFIELENLPGLVVSPWWKELFFLLLSHIDTGVGSNAVGGSGESRRRSYLGWDDRSGRSR